MDYSFVVPLVVAGITGYIARRSGDEIAYLTGTLAAIALILSLILAPWQLQVVILIGTVIGVAAIWPKERTEVPESTPEPSLDNPKAKIKKYRGAIVNSTDKPAAATVHTSAMKYRGANLVDKED